MSLSRAASKARVEHESPKMLVFGASANGGVLCEGERTEYESIPGEKTFSE